MTESSLSLLGSAGTSTGSGSFSGFSSYKKMKWNISFHFLRNDNHATLTRSTSWCSPPTEARRAPWEFHGPWPAGGRSDSPQAWWTLTGHHCDPLPSVLMHKLSLPVAASLPPLRSELAWGTGAACLWEGRQAEGSGRGHALQTVPSPTSMC